MIISSRCYVSEILKPLNFMKCISILWIYITGAIENLADLFNNICYFKIKDIGSTDKNWFKIICGRKCLLFQFPLIAKKICHLFLSNL